MESLRTEEIPDMAGAQAYKVRVTDGEAREGQGPHSTVTCKRLRT